MSVLTVVTPGLPTDGRMVCGLAPRPVILISTLLGRQLLPDTTVLRAQLDALACVKLAQRR